MLEGIIQLGNAVLEHGDILSGLIEDIQPINKKGKQKHVLKICFSTKESRIKLDANEEIDSNTASKYLFVGSADGPNSPQWFASSSSYVYHLTETLYNLTKIDFGEEINNNIKYIFENYYVDLGEYFKPKNRYVINMFSYGMYDEDLLEFSSKIKKAEEEENISGDDEKQNYKNITTILKSTFTKAFKEYVKKETEIKEDEIGLYVIVIDDTPLSFFNEYREAILLEKQKSKKKNKVQSEIFCNICNSTEAVTADLSKMQIKYYTTNQVIFASDFNKGNYGKNMLLCKNCLDKLLVGENYIKNNLDTRLMGFTVYLIPHFIFGIPMNKSELDNVSTHIRKSFNTVKSLKSVDDLKSAIEEIQEDLEQENYFLLNLMFYKKSNQATKIQKLLKDINPSIFQDILKASHKSQKLAKACIGDNYKNKVDLQSFYFMTPIRVKNSEPMQYRCMLQIYEAIFTKQKISKDKFISNVLECTAIEHFGKEGYNVRSDEGMEYTILTSNFCIKFLEYMGCMEEGEALDLKNLNVKDDIKNYIISMKYSEQQTAMFLLGYLIGEVGNAQYKRISDDKKPILNKLNFSGIDKGKLFRLTNEVFNKLIQEKIRNYNEGIFSQCKNLIDININAWKLNKQENLFYILSGYSYATIKPMLNKKENEKIIAG